jgi:anti-sigma factor RsiW
MKCVQITERLAAYLDGQLAPAEAEQVGEHLYSCTPCHQLCDALMAQDFSPMSEDDKAAGCAAAGFWSAMDDALETELQALSPNTGGSKRTTRLPMTVLMAYAAAVLLAVAWGYQQMERADAAEASASHLLQQLEQERRLAAEPQSAPGVPVYRPVAYTPQRATF